MSDNSSSSPFPAGYILADKIKTVMDCAAPTCRASMAAFTEGEPDLAALERDMAAHHNWLKIPNLPRLERSWLCSDHNPFTRLVRDVEVETSIVHYPIPGMPKISVIGYPDVSGGTLSIRDHTGGAVILPAQMLRSILADLDREAGR